MSGSTTSGYEFGPFRLQTDKRRLCRDGEPIPLTPKAFDTLLALVQNAGSLVEKDELMRTVWPDTVVEEGGLSRNISVLRKALGESPDDHHYIVTAPGRGYRFVATVRELIDASGEPAPAEATGPETEPPQRRPLTRTNPLSRGTTAAGLGLVLLATLAWLMLRRLEAPAPFRQMSMTRLTNSGKSRDAAISPDGRQVAYVMEEGGQQSLRLRIVASAREVELAPPADVQYWGLTFSNDGRFIYSVVWETNKADAILYRRPVLGGTASKLLSDIDGPATLSPDGRRLAFVVNASTQGQSRLMLADTDGTQERSLADRQQPAFFRMYPGGPAWSPGGEAIATAGGSVDAGGRYQTVIEVRVRDGAEMPISFERWSDLERLAWLPDGRGLVAAARSQPSAPQQLWQIGYPDGRLSRITNDLNDYSGVSLTADASLLATVQTDRLSSLWVVPVAKAPQEGRAASWGPSRDGLDGVAWASDGRIVYTSRASGSRDLWVMKRDGSDRRQLTAETRTNIHPAVCPGADPIVFASDRAGSFNIWRMDTDGGDPRQLTTGNGEVYPQCSPDGRWVVYQKGYGAGAKMTLWRVPIEGGQPVQISDSLSLQPAISPDGKLIAHYDLRHEADPQWGVTVIPFGGGAPLRRFSIPVSELSRLVRWSPDGRALTYIDGSEGNLWSQPLAGGPPVRLTDFKAERTFSFDWEPSGEQLVCARGLLTSDVVLIRDFR